MNLKMKNICHPELVSGSRNGFRNKFGMTGESGRSMVEMLGVLAIVGVISIGGIAGYIYGMNRYRTNEILDGANKRAVLVSSQLASEITPNLTEFVDYDETAGGTFSSDVQRWENEFGIKISGVKKEVCENLIRMIGDNTPLRSITTIDDPETDLTTGGCAEGTDNDLYLVYNLEMLSKGAVDSGDRSGTGTNVPEPISCEPDNDEDCSDGSICDESTHTCVCPYGGVYIPAEYCCKNGRSYDGLDDDYTEDLRACCEFSGRTWDQTNYKCN